MPKLIISEVVDHKHQDEDNPLENLVSSGLTPKKWLSDPKNFHLSLVGALKLASPSLIQEIKIGNAGSSSIAILVTNNPDGKWSVLLLEHKLRSEEDCKMKQNICTVQKLSADDFKKETACMPWSYVRILCYNQFRRDVNDQFGLTFIHIYGEPKKHYPVSFNSPKSPAGNNSRLLTKKSPMTTGSIARLERMMIASKAKSAPTSPVESKTLSVENDVFDTCVLSFLESLPFKNMSETDILSRWEDTNGRCCSFREKQRFFRLVKDLNDKNKACGILTPHDNNRPRCTLPLGKSIKDATMNVLKPHLNDNVNAFGRDNSPVVFRSESMTKPIKENGVFVDQSTKENQHPYMRPAKCTTPDTATDTLYSGKKLTGKKIWTGGRSEEEEDEDTSPNQSFKRKSEDRSLLSKKRLRDARTNGWSGRRVSPLRNGVALSPPPRPDSPPVVDDIDKPSTSSTETIAERNIRLEIERRLAQRTPQDRVMRAPSGKVRGPYCTKGVTVRTSPTEANSPLSRLSISEDTDEETRQARRKLHFPKSNGVTNMVECPFCSSLYESTDIEQHASECSPSPRKQQPPEDDEEGDMMACPICMTFVSKDTVAAHADQCALKRYGA